MPSPSRPGLFGAAARFGHGAAGRVGQGGSEPLRARDQTPRPLYVGWTRYSAVLPDTKGLDLAAASRHQNAEDYRAHLWAPNRMAARSRIFFELSVPLLQTMRERHDYQHVVTYSPEMPERWLSQLFESARKYDVLDLRPVAAGGPVEALADHLVRSGRRSGPAVWFRVDDDDLLPTDYLDLVDAHVSHVGPGWSVCMGMGDDGLWHDGAVHHLRRRRRPNGSHGQAFSGWWDGDTGALEIPLPGNRRTVDRRTPTVVDSTALAWIRLSHLWQDSTQEEPTFESLAAPLLRNPSRPPSGDTDLLSRWPTLSGVYRPDPS